MKTLMRILTVAVALLIAVPLSAQTYLTNTTITQAMTVNSTTATVNSTTNVQVGGFLYIDHELMRITAVNTTTKIVNLARQTQVAPTKIAAHGSGAIAYVITTAQAPTNAVSHDTAWRAGQCSTSTSSSSTVALTPALTGYQFLPVIDVEWGDFYACRRVTGGLWVWVRYNVQGFNALDGSLPTAWP